MAQPAEPAAAGGGSRDVATKNPASSEALPPRLSDEGRWYVEHAALVVTTLKWAVLGAGACVGWGTRAFLFSLAACTGSSGW